jgi:hypothetical protein
MHLEMRKVGAAFENKGKARSNTHIDDTQRLVTEIEMLKVVLHLALAARLAS